MIELIGGSIFIIIMLLFVYIGSIVQEESRTKTRIPLIWEKDHAMRIAMRQRKIFNKADVVYRDGDNT